MKYYSQFGEDKFIHENNLLPEKGFFVDIGAGDPKEGSNTFLFEELGWDGICIDADPKQVEKLRAVRKSKVIHCAIMNYDGKAMIDLHPSGALSRISKNGKTEVSCFKFSTIMRTHGIGKIDLLSIDVEGQEMEVLKSIGKMKLDDMPKVLIVEHVSHVDGDRSQEILDFLDQRFYTLVHRTNSNLIFKLATSEVKDENPEAVSFGMPALSPC